jgi:hypothetical protein
MNTNEDSYCPHILFPGLMKYGIKDHTKICSPNAISVHIDHKDQIEINRFPQKFIMVQIIGKWHKT